MNNLDEIKQEILWSDSAEGCQKDILIVIHNQLEYVKICLDSIFSSTNNFNIHLWNNNSDKTTTEYLNKIAKLSNVKLYQSEENLGFIIPNNTMVKECQSDWIILLNSDTEVIKNWDTVLIGTLINNPEILQVGFCGGMLDKQGRGIFEKSGSEIDYVCGYCFCINKKTYEQFGLFDEKNLEFAYCEDSDFSLRLREAGKKIYACYAKEFVRHYKNKTSLQILNKQKFAECIEKNQNHIARRWANYIK
jgi:GT2 family glycosyltransferase